MIDYSHDEYFLEDIHQFPEAVIKPENTQKVSEIIKLCAQENIPLTPRGSATGLCGGSVPVIGGLSLSFENMTRIEEVDPSNLTVTVESGVKLMDFYPAVEKAGLFFPPHPGDESATFGGMIATNAGGARAVKYGVIRNFIKGIEAVLATGEIINIGGKYIKSSSGYNLLNLLIGSEGTLAVITKAIISLLPPPGAIYTLIAPYENLHDAINTVPALIKGRILPMAVEFVEKEVITLSESHLNKKWPCQQGNAFLIIIIDASSEDEAMILAEKVSKVCTKNRALDLFVADSREKQENILKIRSHIYDSIKKHMLELLDISVPRSEIARFVDETHKLEKEHDIWIPTYGHAADGNVHHHIMKARWQDGEWKETAGWKEKYPAVRKKLHELGKQYNGAVSGEHGIGMVKKEYLEMFLGKKQVRLMKEIKKVFDTSGILNPGKIF